MTKTTQFDPNLNLYVMTEDRGTGGKTIYTYLDEDCDTLHSVNDQPAVIAIDGNGDVFCQRWFKYGWDHRDNDLPASIFVGVYQEWCQNGNRHRNDNKPAIVYDNGNLSYYHHGKLHRTNGGPAQINGDYQIWAAHGNYYREDGGPTVVENDGTQMWIVDEVDRDGDEESNISLHNEHGPAVIAPDGTEEYWLGNVQYTKEQFEKYTKLK